MIAGNATIDIIRRLLAENADQQSTRHKMLNDSEIVAIANLMDIWQFVMAMRQDGDWTKLTPAPALNNPTTCPKVESKRAGAGDLKTQSEGSRLWI